MSEDEWLNDPTPESALRWLRGRSDRGFPEFARRKARLLACACCRLRWQELDELQREAVSYAEQVADGAPLSGERLTELTRALFEANGRPGQYTPARAAPLWLLRGVGNDWSSDFRIPDVWWLTVAGGEGRALLHCLLGDLSPPRALAPAIRAWDGGKVVKVATPIYEGHRFEDMPLLGDVLEEAGCQGPALLAHCRGPGPHARGCHVLDAALGRA
jgi:hypothetical protein